MGAVLGNTPSVARVTATAVRGECGPVLGDPRGSAVLPPLPQSRFSSLLIWSCNSALFSLLSEELAVNLHPPQSCAKPLAPGASECDSDYSDGLLVEVITGGH